MSQMCPHAAPHDDEKGQISHKEDVDKGVVTPAEASISTASVSEQERKLVRKLDRRIIPTVCLIYLFACACSFRFIELAATLLFQSLTPHTDLDRTNLGNARLQGLPQDILGGDPTGVLFDWVNSAFFFSYVSLVCSIIIKAT